MPLWKDLSPDDLEKASDETLTHPECLRTGMCQETEGFKGTEHEGVDVCEDGCVWYKPKKMNNSEYKRLSDMKATIAFFAGFSLGVFLMIFLDLILS